MKEILILVTTLFLAGCSGNNPAPKAPENGIHKSYYKNGALYQVTPYKNGKRNGNVITYYDNGMLWNEYEYVDDMKNGIAKRYNTKGNLYLIGRYKNDKQHGKQEYYDKNGKLKETSVFINDVEVEAFEDSKKNLKKHRKKYAQQKAEEKACKSQLKSLINKHDQTGNYTLAIAQKTTECNRLTQFADSTSALIWQIESLQKDRQKLMKQ